jgi:hypothetical protein
MLLTYWVKTPTWIVLFAELQKYWRRPGNTAAYIDFKKEMWANRPVVEEAKPNDPDPGGRDGVARAPDVNSLTHHGTDRGKKS